MVKEKVVSIPLSYASFLILLSLKEPSHGYEIMKFISHVTDDVIKIGPATMYRSLSEFLDNDYIQLISEANNKKMYQITEKGQKLLTEQIKFFDLLHTVAHREDESE